jgi:hypothetical protein
VENESHFQNSWNFVMSTKENAMVVDSVEEKTSMKEGKV